jgi:acetolactate synthase-1/2/3 large subunit
MQSITKVAKTVFDATSVPAEVDAAVTSALTPHRGPVFLDFPMDSLFRPVSSDIPDGARTPRGADPDPDRLDSVATLLSESSRPVLIAGSDVWWDGAWEALVRLAEAWRLPTIVNGMGRGCIPADHALAFARARSLALKEADLVLVAGTPLDFRLGFGRFGEARVVHIQDSAGGIGEHAKPAAAVAGDLSASLDGIAGRVPARPDHEAWIERLRGEETARRERERDELESDAYPIHPARVYGALRAKLDRDAVVIGDGGDFVSYAGRLVDSYVPGAWMDPGPYGCLGTGLGYAIAARCVHPDRQVVLMLGDGAAGFNLLDFDTLVRHNLPVVAIVGNNGIWGLEKHPMKAIYGWDVAADLRQEARYDDVVKALGGAGETVEKSQDLEAAIDRGFAAGAPYLINVLTDPAVAYPRSSNLA